MIIANFEGNESVKYVSGLYQYDKEQILQITGLNLPRVVEIDFSLEETGATSKSCPAITKDGITEVMIPNEMLVNQDTDMNYNIYAFVYVTDASTSETVKRIVMQVRARTKPEQFEALGNRELFEKAINEVNNSADRAETAANTSEQNAKKTAEDRTAIEEMVETVSGIEQQVQDVKKYAGKAETAASNAALSEQKAKESETAALQAKADAETAKGSAETAAGKTAEDRTAVESAKEEVLQAKQQVSTDRAAVEAVERKVAQMGNAIPQAVLEGIQAVGSAGAAEKQGIVQAGTEQKSAVESTGTKAVEDITLAKKSATDAVETAKTGAVGAIGTAGTEQTQNVTAEGEKQVKAVVDKGAEVLQSIPEDFTTQMQSKLDKNQGAENNGKILGIGEYGLVVPIEKPSGVVDLDTTLTSPDKAAPANLVGGLKENLNILRDIKVDGIKSSNLFNKNTNTDGYYVSYEGLSPNTNFSASDFIKVEKGSVYSLTYVTNSRFYNKEKETIGTITETPFTVPENAAYIRVSMNVKDKDTFMLIKGSVLPSKYIPYGTVLSIKSFDDDLIEKLKTELDVKDVPINYDYLNHIRNSLNNPFVKTQIKLVGDSITHGMGGTGFSPNGNLIGGSSERQNDLNATCWANMLYHYVDENYNKITEVNLLDESIEKKSYSSAIGSAEVEQGSVRIKYDYITETNGVDEREFMKFSFYGTQFIIYNEISIDRGKYKVYVDDVLVKTVDCYSTIQNVRNNIIIEGLDKTAHTVSLRCSNSKNDNSSSKHIRITGLSVEKIATVLPWGVSGSMSEGVLNTNGRFSKDDDFVIIMYGTNDRHVYFNKWNTYKNLIKGAEQIKTLYGAEPIFMIACPASQDYESNNGVERFYHMWDVHDVIVEVGKYFGVPVIDNYTAFIKYADDHKMTTDDLLADGLHPNDLGHKVIFNNIMCDLGLARFPHYKEWKRE